MPKLNQIIAVVNSKKTESAKAITQIYHLVQKSTLFDGMIKSYESMEENGEPLPGETKLLQLKAGEAINSFALAQSDLFDTVYTQDCANTKAKADLEVDGTMIAKDVPVTYLLFLEKKLTDIHTFVESLPVLDPAQEWKYDPNQDCYTTSPSWKYHTKKLARVIEKSPATDKHPAQVEVIHEDRNVGKWITTNHSGALRLTEKRLMLQRVKILLEAVKKARESANMIEAENKNIASPIFNLIFGK